MRLALYQPDIPQNTGTILRMAACLGLYVDIIGPTGFSLSDRALKRAGLDYLDKAAFVLHQDFDAFIKERIESKEVRLILATTHAKNSYIDHDFSSQDIILFGRESAGVPKTVFDIADKTIKIPIKKDTRSLNLAVSTALVMGEALRQTKAFPE